jgi:hypothetical protein
LLKRPPLLDFRVSKEGFVLNKVTLEFAQEQAKKGIEAPQRGKRVEF